MMTLQNWKTQLRKGLLELCILNCLNRMDFYGYDLVQELKPTDSLAMREGNVYPILARLQEDGFVVRRTESSNSGPPRKYFAITRAGRDALDKMNEHWNQIEESVLSTRRNREESPT